MCGHVNRLFMRCQAATRHLVRLERQPGRDRLGFGSSGRTATKAQVTRLEQETAKTASSNSICETQDCCLPISQELRKPTPRTSVTGECNVLVRQCGCWHTASSGNWASFSIKSDCLGTPSRFPVMPPLDSCGCVRRLALGIMQEAA